MPILDFKPSVLFLSTYLQSMRFELLMHVIFCLPQSVFHLFFLMLRYPLLPLDSRVYLKHDLELNQIFWGLNLEVRCIGYEAQHKPSRTF